MKSMKKIMYIAPFPIVPLDTGTKIRVYQTVKFLARYYELYITILSDTDKRVIQLPEKIYAEMNVIAPVSMRLRGGGLVIALISKYLSLRPCIYNKYTRNTLQKEIVRIRPDAVIVWGTSTIQYLKIRDKIPATIYLLDEAGTDHLRIKSDIPFAARWLDKAVMYLKYLRMMWYERRICSAADHILAVEPGEVHYLTSTVKHPSVHYVPCGANTDLYEYTYAGDKNSTILFCGDLTYPPNEDAMIFCLREIIPLLRTKTKHFSFLVIGRMNTTFIKEYAKPFKEVSVLGYVNAMNEYWKKASIFLNPVRTGRGFLTKILDAFSAGLAVVSTSTFLRETDISNGYHYLKGDTASELVEGVGKLLDDPQLKKKLSLNGRLYAERHGWNTTLKPLKHLLERGGNR